MRRVTTWHRLVQINEMRVMWAARIAGYGEPAEGTWDKVGVAGPQAWKLLARYNTEVYIVMVGEIGRKI